MRKKILIVSDTHQRNENYFKVLKLEAPLDLVIHCGDIEGSEYAISSAADCPVEMVGGNNDYFSDLAYEREIRIGKYRVWLTHGNTHYVSTGYDILRQEARLKGVDMVFFGHTHRPFLEITSTLTLLNPGSLSYPRQEGKQPSYAIMEIDEKGETHFKIKYLQS